MSKGTINLASLKARLFAGVGIIMVVQMSIDVPSLNIEKYSEVRLVLLENYPANPLSQHLINIFNDIINWFVLL